MELVFVVTVGGLLGLAVRFIVRGRESHGLAVLPSLGVIVGSLVWALAIWVGLDGGTVWPWVLSLGLALASVILGAVAIPRRRAHADTALWAELTTG